MDRLREISPIDNSRNNRIVHSHKIVKIQLVQTNKEYAITYY